MVSSVVMGGILHVMQHCARAKLHIMQQIARKEARASATGAAKWRALFGPQRLAGIQADAYSVINLAGTFWMTECDFLDRLRGLTQSQRDKLIDLMAAEGLLPGQSAPAIGRASQAEQTEKR